MQGAQHVVMSAMRWRLHDVATKHKRDHIACAQNAATGGYFMCACRRDWRNFCTKAASKSLQAQAWMITNMAAHAAEVTHCEMTKGATSQCNALGASEF
eukprot:5157657-Amphidinium_carterae.1